MKIAKAIFNSMKLYDKHFLYIMKLSDKLFSKNEIQKKIKF